MKAALGPARFVGGTVLPFLIPGNTERCRGNGFLVLASSTQIQALRAAVVCLGEPRKRTSQNQLSSCGSGLHHAQCGEVNPEMSRGEKIPFTPCTHFVQVKGLGLKTKIIATSLRKVAARFSSAVL